MIRSSDSDMNDQISLIKYLEDDMEIKAILYDEFLNTDGTFTITEVAKILGGTTTELASDLRNDIGWLFKKKKGIIPTFKALHNGWMIAVPRDKTVKGKPNCYGRITKYGLQKLMYTYGNV